METVDAIRHTAPADQPQSVHQLTGRLFDAYRVEGGSVRLAGCTLDDRLFLRCDYNTESPSRSLFLDDRLQPMRPELVAELGMDRLVVLASPPKQCRDDLNRIQAALRERTGSGEPTSGGMPAVTAVWVKFAEGRLRFDIGEQTAELAFSGWARSLKPPPWICPVSGRATYRLAATDDGRIVAAESLARCEVTGRIVTSAELVTCAATGKNVLPELTVVCPVSEQRVLAESLVACSSCNQAVASFVLIGGRCTACRSLAAVGPDDPRMARILSEHPEWERWRHWRLSETAAVYILTCARWLRCLLLVVDRQTLELKHVAVGHRFFGDWEPLPADQWPLVISE